MAYCVCLLLLLLHLLPMTSPQPRSVPLTAARSNFFPWRNFVHMMPRLEHPLVFTCVFLPPPCCSLCFRELWMHFSAPRLPPGASVSFFYVLSAASPFNPPSSEYCLAFFPARLQMAFGSFFSFLVRSRRAFVRPAGRRQTTSRCIGRFPPIVFMFGLGRDAPLLPICAFSAY